MKRIVSVLVLALVVAVGIGCNAQRRQPRLTSATITPARLRPGDSAIITVKVERDRFDIVETVSAVVQEDRRMRFDLKDDGNAPDAEARDGIWSLLVDVPFMAPPGNFTLEFTGYDAKGGLISVVGPQGGGTPLSTTCVFSVEHSLTDAPEEGAAETQPTENN
ncbi:MAG TPA: hypothetical protein PLB67_06535 [Candidatus Hydrogenedentes bacterium]|jgi:hypothetical protein|nr:hypothetical protein [Candidatus Hydrogenedentota bacterium]MDY0031016.1 choice-of-anchor X domain-containing protein [FCB group bacterium]NLT62139.1 hypothetical protein [Candidatus Hydrogenedentota bacterium]HNV21776.1 hypothetical protein [Candidatus Hydrogenedentota bacterium]HNZ20160.1 hypothetical protein [Candidatus Hydrogenedentota bacterium]